MPWRYEENPHLAINGLRDSGYAIIALELTELAVPYHDYHYPERTCIVVGHEDHGVTKSTLSVCDASVFIPMYGFKKSMNLHHALAVAGQKIIETWS